MLPLRLSTSFASEQMASLSVRSSATKNLPPSKRQCEKFIVARKLERCARVAEKRDAIFLFDGSKDTSLRIGRTEEGGFWETSEAEGVRWWGGGSVKKSVTCICKGRKKNVAGSKRIFVLARTRFSDARVRVLCQKTGKRGVATTRTQCHSSTEAPSLRMVLPVVQSGNGKVDGPLPLPSSSPALRRPPGRHNSRGPRPKRRNGANERRKSEPGRFVSPNHRRSSSQPPPSPSATVPHALR